MYNRHTTEKQSAETARASQDAQQGGTDASSRMNAPTLSDGKVSDNSSSAQDAPSYGRQKSFDFDGATAPRTDQKSLIVFGEETAERAPKPDGKPKPPNGPTQR